MTADIDSKVTSFLTISVTSIMLLTKSPMILNISESSFNLA